MTYSQVLGIKMWALLLCQAQIPSLKGGREPQDSFLRSLDLCLRQISRSQADSGEVRPGRPFRRCYSVEARVKTDGEDGDSAQGRRVWLRGCSCACISEVLEVRGPLNIMHHSPGFLSGTCRQLERPWPGTCKRWRVAPPSCGPCYLLCGCREELLWQSPRPGLSSRPGISTQVLFQEALGGCGTTSFTAG